jgi:hypothetical protein
VSRSNETLVFLDGPAIERDPLLQQLIDDGVAEESGLSHLVDILEARGFDPLERTLQFLAEASDLLEVDLERARRTLARADGALENVHDPHARRQAHEERIGTRQRVAAHLLKLGAEASATSDGQAVAWHAPAGEQIAEIGRSMEAIGRRAEASTYSLVGLRYTEAPPSAADVAEKLPNLYGALVGAMADLSKRARQGSLSRFAREWRDELSGLDWTRLSGAQKSIVEAADRFAELTGTESDSQAAAELRRQAAAALITRSAWPDAVALLEELPDPEPGQLAHCYEGLQQWERAGNLREQAGQLAEALDDLRRAGLLERAGQLAERLEQPELARQLGLAAQIASLDNLGPVDFPDLTDPELRRVAESLRRAAERLTPRAARGAHQRRR